MAGNVREWTHDWYGFDYYTSDLTKNPQGPGTGILKIIKGGSWHSFKADVRSASRGKGGFALKTDGIGFRCAKPMKLKN
jgi:formylglycine-generating enzyme required for sulfatase activity